MTVVSPVFLLSATGKMSLLRDLWVHRAKEGSLSCPGSFQSPFHPKLGKQGLNTNNSALKHMLTV